MGNCSEFAKQTDTGTKSGTGLVSASNLGEIMDGTVCSERCQQGIMDDKSALHLLVDLEAAEWSHLLGDRMRPNALGGKIVQEGAMWLKHC